MLRLSARPIDAVIRHKPNPPTTKVVVVTDAVAAIHVSLSCYMPSQRQKVSVQANLENDHHWQKSLSKHGVFMRTYPDHQSLQFGHYLIPEHKYAGALNQSRISWLAGICSKKMKKQTHFLMAKMWPDRRQLGAATLVQPTLLTILVIRFIAILLRNIERGVGDSETTSGRSSSASKLGPSFHPFK